MRPLRIELKGFSTFLDSTTVNLDGLDLVAFTGQTGSGKSSLIDAMTFALYGSVARYAKEKQVAPAIHSLASEARVRLDFEVSHKRYAAVRVLRRKVQKDPSAPSSASTKEARLEDLDSGEVLAGNVKELNAKVVEVLGLDFNQFTRTIVLPQGDFADFLNDEPANRQKLLRRLLDMEIYAKMGKVARSDAKIANQQASVLAAEQQRDPAPTDKELAILTDKHAALVEAHPAIKIALTELETVGSKRQLLLEEHNSVTDAIKRLRAVKVPPELALADQQLRERQDNQTEAKTLLADAQSKLKQLSSDDLEPLADLGLAIDRLERLVGLRAESENLQTRESELAKTLDRLDREGAELVNNRDATEAAFASAQTAVDAVSILAGLSVGDPCPLCHQTVASVPDHDPNHELRQAKAAVDDATNQHKKWEHQRATVNAELKELRRTIDGASSTQSDLQAQLEASPSVASSSLSGPKPKLTKEIEALTAKRDEMLLVAEQVKAARTDVETAQKNLTKIESQVGDVESQVKRQGSQFSAARDAVADLEPPGVSEGSTVENWDTLAKWAEERIEACETRAGEVVERGKDVAEELKAKQALLAQKAQRLGLAVGDGEFGQLFDVLLVATTKMQAALDHAMAHREQAKERDTRIVGLRQEAELNKTLGAHLDASGFEGWLLNEALDNIVGKATERLLQLSAGQYSLLVADRQFAIIDHNNADERRDVRTLSGGETFLASLALALALADSIAELAPVDAPRLESMFLDEGFGTLDPETLDVVASAIEELAADGRMIGIVTHVRDLAERLPVRFEVSKGPTSSTVELIEL